MIVFLKLFHGAMFSTFFNIKAMSYDRYERESAHEPTRQAAADAGMKLRALQTGSVHQKAALLLKAIAV